MKRKFEYSYLHPETDLFISLVKCQNTDCKYFNQVPTFKKVIKIADDKYGGVGSGMARYYCCSCLDYIQINDPNCEVFIDAYCNEFGVSDIEVHPLLQDDPFSLDFRKLTLRFNKIQFGKHLTSSILFHEPFPRKIRRFDNLYKVIKGYYGLFNLARPSSLCIDTAAAKASGWFALGVKKEKIKNQLSKQIDFLMDYLFFANKIKKTNMLLGYIYETEDRFIDVYNALCLTFWFKNDLNAPVQSEYKKFIDLNFKLIGPFISDLHRQHLTNQLTLLNWYETANRTLKETQLSLKLGFNKAEGINVIANNRNDVLNDLEIIFRWKRLMLECGGETHWNIFHKFLDFPLLMLVRFWLNDNLISLEKDIPLDMLPFFEPLTW